MLQGPAVEAISMAEIVLGLCAPVLRITDGLSVLAAARGAAARGKLTQRLFALTSNVAMVNITIDGERIYVPIIRR